GESHAKASVGAGGLRYRACGGPRFFFSWCCGWERVRYGGRVVGLGGDQYVHVHGRGGGYVYGARWGWLGAGGRGWRRGRGWWRAVAAVVVVAFPHPQPEDRGAARAGPPTAVPATAGTPQIPQIALAVVVSCLLAVLAGRET